MNLDAPDDLGIITTNHPTIAALLWERHGSTVVYTSARHPLPPPATSPTLSIFQDGKWRPITGISEVRIHPDTPKDQT